MRILALESSAKAASVAVVNDGAPEAYAFQNRGLTHSRTLMPMVRSVLDNAGLTLGDVDLVAASNGPGSFTGVRIGAAAAKGIAWAAGKPCAGVSTLEAMACGAAALRGILCCVMDARRNEFYQAFFESDGAAAMRLCGDRAVSLDALTAALAAFNGPVWLVGDGAKLAYGALQGTFPALKVAPPNLMHQNAYGVSAAAAAALERGISTDLTSLDPVYIRLSQAERERLDREKAKEEKSISHDVKHA